MRASKKWWIGFGLSLQNLAGAEDVSGFQRAQAEFDAGIYAQAIPKFEALLNAPDDQNTSLIRSELAYAYLQTGQGKEAEALLENHILQPEDYYLLGTAYQLNHKPKKAIAALEAYLSQTSVPLRFRDPAELQLGQALFAEGQPTLGESHLLAVTFDPDKPELFVNARLECARLAFAQGKHVLAEERLRPIGELLPANHPLMQKYAYVRGDMLVQAEEYSEAIPWLEKALPKKNADKADWTPDTLYDLGLAYMHSGNNSEENLVRAQGFLQRLFDMAPTEKAALTLGRCLLCRAKTTKNDELYQKADVLLSMQGLFKSPEAKAQALLLRADAAPIDQAKQFFEQAVAYVKATQASDATAYLYGAAALRLKSKDPTYGELDNVPEILEGGLAHAPSGPYAPALLLMLGTYHQNLGQHAQAEKALLKLTESFPKSADAAEAWFRLSKSAQVLGRDPDSIRSYRRFVYEQFPDSPLAAETYFTTFSYREYLQGDRRAMRHLEGMQTHYPKSPYTLNALYLIGLDYLRDRKTPEGRWIRKKSPTTAIDTFQRSEVLFDELRQKELIPTEAMAYYIALNNRTILERALANYAVAEASSGAKRQIYLDYAIDVFQKLRQELSSQDAVDLLEETEYSLAQAYLKARQDKQAEALFDGMLARYGNLGKTQGYYLSRVWAEKGAIAMRQEHYQAAIQAFQQAEVAAKGDLLSPDQLLGIWIDLSQCYRALGELDQSMLTLSKVINENVVSSLRIKAMVLRAEIYELEGRKDLARNQLESAAKKGGEWAARAKEILKEGYYYD